MHQFLSELQYTEIWYWIERKTNKHRTARRIMAAGMPYMNIRFKLPFAKNLRNNQDLSFNIPRRRARGQPPKPTVFRIGWRDIDEIPGLLSANNGTTKIQWQGHVQDEVYLGQCGQFFVGKVETKDTPELDWIWWKGVKMQSYIIVHANPFGKGFEISSMLSACLQTPKNRLPRHGNLQHFWIKTNCISQVAL